MVIQVDNIFHVWLYFRSTVGINEKLIRCHVVKSKELQCDITFNKVKHKVNIFLEYRIKYYLWIIMFK